MAGALKHDWKHCSNGVALSAAVIVPPVGGQVRHTNPARGLTQRGATFEVSVQCL